MTNIVLIQGSMKPDSRTAVAVAEVALQLAERKIDHEIIDLRTIEMPFCDGRDLQKYPQPVLDAYARLEKANGYVVGMPVYQYSIAGPLKNFLDIALDAMQGKVTGIVCNSGGARSYLAAADLMKCLSFEGDVTTVQPIVHTTKEDFRDGKLTNVDLRPRMGRMLDALLHDCRTTH